MKAHLILNVFFGHLISLALGFTNPIRTGSDPQIVYHGGMYYLTSTTWTDVRITAASTIEGLKTAESVVIWSDVSDPDRACNFWAPEIHKVGDRWHVYFTASKCDPDWGVVLPTLKVYVLEGGMEHPLSSDYRLLDPIVPPNYNGGMLDATLFDIADTRYLLFSAVNGPESPDGASLWIAELLSAVTCGNATMIAAPEYEWEKEDSAVLEGPYGIISPSGTTMVVYSADSCSTPAYKLGVMTLTAGADPLRRASWIKSSTPIFETKNGLYGPGHNAFFKSPDGKQDWQVFHANLEANAGCGPSRKTFIQPVSWKGDHIDLGDPLPVSTEIDPPSGE
ncbi:glycosyl hydrolase [Fusarium flagelliforme]|uniref:glycosyl hydrolase n=1 Tax=Fusarium flagelliforme TaxID=2675880 RepID=UPI001E8DAF94|nr:glycosyl hydrolase [Fusarium flagelliforme]KAH7174078.1 glycosyl hydrolase [Fusarium flagelliforme]